MRYSIDSNSLRLIIENRGDSIDFNIEAYNKRQRQFEEDNLFKFVNGFLAYIPAKQADDFFYEMANLREAFNQIGGVAEVKNANIKKGIVKLVNMIDEEQIMEWVMTTPELPIPTSLKDDYTPSDRDQDKTYLKHEYSGLLVLAITGQLLLGVFGEYMKKYADSVGDFKEYSLLRMMDDTWLKDNESINRLRNYIDASIKQHNLSEVAIIGGLSSLELIEFFLANIFIRRLAVTPIDSSLQSGGLMAAVYKGYNTVKNNLSYKMSPLTDKASMNSNSGRDEGGSNWSIIELYKITQEVGFDDTAIHRRVAKETLKLGLSIDDSLPIELLQESVINATVRLNRFPLQEHAVLLVQWVLRTHMPARMIYNLDKPTMLQLMGLTQLLLWHWDFKDLALLVTSKIDRDTLVTNSISNRPKRQVRTNPMEEFNIKYPYHRLTRTASRDRNPAHAAISSFNESILRYWLKNNPPDYLKEYATEVEIDRRGSLAPEDLITQLAEMLVFIEKRVS